MSKVEKQPTAQEVANNFNAMKQELSAIAQKLGELDMEKDEHQLVIDTLEPLDPSRKCFRLVGGVLVERTVKDVLPAVKTNLDGIKNIVNQLAQTYNKKEAEMEAYKKKYNIQVKSG